MREILVIAYLLPPFIFYIIKAGRALFLNRETKFEIEVQDSEPDIIDVSMKGSATFLLFIPIYNWYTIARVVHSVMTGPKEW